MNNNTIKQFNLPSYLKNKSFADASKAIEKRFKGRNDKASLTTKKVLLERLAQAQESTKEELGLNQEQNPEQNQAFFGDLFGPAGGAANGSAATGEVTGEAAGGPGVGAYLGAASGALEMGNNLFGKTGVDTSGNQHYNKVATGGAALSGAMKGAQAGMALGPLGAGIGGVLGGVTSLFGANKKNKEIDDANHNFTLAQNAQYRQSDFAFGGLSNPNDKKKLNEAQVNDVNKATGIEFTMEGANTLFENPDEIAAKKLPNVKLGKYKDVGYFDITANGDSYNVSPTIKNPGNPNLYKQQVASLQKLNPSLKFNSNYIPMSDRVGSKSSNINRDALHTNNGLLAENYAKGGYMNKYNIGGPVSELTPEGIQPVIDFSTQLLHKTPQYNAPKQNFGETLGNIGEKAGKFLKDNYADILRYAPVGANALQLKNLEKPNYERLNKLDNRYKKDYVDEQSLQNIVSNQAGNTRRALMESSGGDLGATRSNLLASQLNATKSMSNAYLEAENINRGENTREQQFNLGVDQTNLQQSNLENDINARNKGAYNTAKSKLIGQLGTDVGNIGREEKFKQMVKDSGLCYDTRGAYICGTEERLTKEDLEKVGKTPGINENRYGGYNETSTEMFNTYLNKLLK